ncbi:Diadenosine tetraphosphate (Ap4A) hydrolase and other HIT family hydrolases [hydrothermal vent metagenome]|uniref:Diadenosine tetraphosphate (Ap4A) hydrolase and other HIT family hydrolases n=1 Tax=hydrothermal vent metagenome TaxID=652676 RepID=A0A3B0X7J3_9ZZZZ
MPFTLHPLLQADCYSLGRANNSMLLLHKNALVPWFILVPNTHENELYKLETEQQRNINIKVNQLARFVSEHFKADKLNIATIGNIVPQLHIHIIGRNTTDFCWPEPVWGQSDFAAYESKTLQQIEQSLFDREIIQP